jgi:hypothetical protein
MTERPGEDATSAEIYQWMEESFTEALAEGIESTNEDETAEDGEDDEESDAA